MFAYAAIGALVNPDVWLGYLPHFLVQHSFAHALLRLFAAYELVMTMWLLSGKGRKVVAVLSALTFAGIVLAQPGDLLISFRDVGLLFAALALFSLD